MYQQESWPRLRQAMFTAIDNLRQAGLVQTLPAEEKTITMTPQEAGAWAGSNAQQLKHMHMQMMCAHVLCQ